MLQETSSSSSSETHRLQEGESAHVISLGVEQLVEDTQPQAKLALRVFPRLLGVLACALACALLLHVPAQGILPDNAKTAAWIGPGRAVLYLVHSLEHIPRVLKGKKLSDAGDEPSEPRLVQERTEERRVRN